MIQEVRQLLAELARLNTDVVPLAMRIMDDCATAEEHDAFAERLVALARQFHARAAHLGSVIDGEVTVTTDAERLWQRESGPALRCVRDV